MQNHLALWRDLISLSVRVIDNQNPHSVKGDSEAPGTLGTAAGALRVAGTGAQGRILSASLRLRGSGTASSRCFGHCSSRLSWDTTPIFGPASLSKLCLSECGQVLWKWIHRAEPLLQPSSGTAARKPVCYHNHVISAKC